MRLIDADALAKDLRKAMELQEEAAREYNIVDGTYVNLQRGVMRNVLEIVRKQPTIKGGDGNATD